MSFILWFAHLHHHSFPAASPRSHDLKFLTITLSIILSHLTPFFIISFNCAEKNLHKHLKEWYRAQGSHSFTLSSPIPASSSPSSFLWDPQSEDISHQWYSCSLFQIGSTCGNLIKSAVKLKLEDADVENLLPHLSTEHWFATHRSTRARSTCDQKESSCQ